MKKYGSIWKYFSALDGYRVTGYLNLMNLKETIDACENAGFNEAITREMLWNEAYRLGRSRWYWGPMWWVSFKCGLGSRIAGLFRAQGPQNQGD